MRKPRIAWMGTRLLRRLEITRAWMRGDRMGLHVRLPDGSVRVFVSTAERPTQTRRPLRPADRFRVLERDGFRCRYCGHAAPDTELVVDHVLPVVAGGSDDFANLVTACIPCNQGKASRVMWSGSGLASDEPVAESAA